MRIALFAAVALASAMVAAKPLTKPQALAVMHERHEGMEKIGDTNKLLRRELASDNPFMPTVKSGAATIAGLSKRASVWFPAGTGTGKTGAKPEIWQKPQDFAVKLRNFQAAAAVFQAAVNAGDASAMKARYADMIRSCSACHDTYRMDMHH